MGHVIHVMSPLRAAWIFLADQEVPKDKAAKPKVGAVGPKNHRSSFGDVIRGIFFSKFQLLSRWWFQIFLIFTPTWGNDRI